MEQKMTTEQRIFYIVCVFGGYLGGYALLSRCDVLGAAQTSNMAGIVLSVLGTNLTDFAIRLGAMLLYGAALALTVLIRLRTHLDLRTISIAVSLLGVLILNFIPSGIDNVLGLYPVFFILAFQWNTFTGAKGYSSSCIFSTNNFRQTVCSFVDYIYTKSPSSLVKARFFAGSLIFYHIGVAASFFGDMVLGIHSVTFAIIPLIAAFFEIYADGKTFFLKDTAHE